MATEQPTAASPFALPAGRRVWAGAAVAAFGIAAAVGMGGLVSSKYAGDVLTYAAYGRRLVLDGDVPYHDFYFEYPPGAVPVFALPALLWNAHYHLVFKLLMTLCGAVAVATGVGVLGRVGASGTRTAVAAAAMAVTPAALGPVFLNRYDPVPAALVSLALLALLLERERLALAVLGVAFAVKVYPAVVVPIALIRIWRRRGARAALQAAAACVAAAAAVFAFFLAYGFGGLGFSFYTQAIRHLQIESLGSAFLLAADKLGLHEAHWIAGKPGSIDLGGGLPDAVATLSSAVALAAVIGVVYLYWRGAEDDERLIAATAAAVAAFTVPNKVLSPQYLTWLAFLVPLVAGRAGRAATGLLVLAIALTPAEYFLGDNGLRAVNWTVWLLLVRNGLLVAVLLLLAASLRAGRSARATAAAAPSSI